MSHEIQHTIQIENPQMGPFLVNQERPISLSENLVVSTPSVASTLDVPRIACEKVNSIIDPLALDRISASCPRSCTGAIPFVLCFKTPDVVESVEPTLVHLNFHLTYLKFNRSPLKSYLPQKESNLPTIMFRYVRLPECIVSCTNNLSCYPVIACRACTCSCQRSQAHLGTANCEMVLSDGSPWMAFI